MRSNPWWSFMDHPVAARRAVDVLFIAYYVGLGWAGVSAFIIAPSSAITNVVQAAGAFVWSAGTAGASVVAVVSRLRRAVEAESISLAVLAMLTFIHGAMVIMGNPGLTGIQTGARLLSAPLFMLAVVIHMRHPIIRVPVQKKKKGVGR